MRDRKLIPDTIRSKKKSSNTLFLTTEKRHNDLARLLPYNKTIKQQVCEGYVRSQVHSISCQTPPPSPPSTRRNSSETINQLPVYNQVTAEQIMTNNRKTSLKKMGSCTITVQNEDGTQSVYVNMFALEQFNYLTHLQALGKSIGKGQFGEVFGGLNMDTGEYVAIKRIKRNQMDCDDMVIIDHFL